MKKPSPELYLQIQSLAFEAAEHAASKLEVGMTEREAAQLMQDHLKSRGAHSFFHYPFAWFGDRTCFKNFQQPLAFLEGKFSLGELPHLGGQFMPSKRILQRPMAVILDVAPALDGFFADIGYSTFFGDPPPAYAKALQTLAEVRGAIPATLNAGATIHELYQEVERIFGEAGWKNRHAVYPLGVLGHRVGIMPIPSFLSHLHSKAKIKVMGFSPEAFLYIFKQELPFATPGKDTPFLRAGIHHPPSDGAWAVEPHLGNDEWGAKFEEILMVEGGRARWLNPQPPVFLSKPL